MRALILLLAFGSAFAQTGPNSLPPTGPKPMVIPLPDWASPIYGLPSLTPDAPDAPFYLFTKTGQCMWWYPYKPDMPVNSGAARVYCGVASDFQNVGGRVNTIRKSDDPLTSLNTLPSRISMSKLTCTGLVCTTSNPALQGIVSELNAARAK